MLVEELPYFKRTGQLDSLLQNIYQDTPLQKQDIIITDNVNEALLLSSEENRIIITYEDKLYKISLPNIHQHILMDSPMISQFSFVWKTTEINNALSPFLTYISKINWDSVNSIPK